DQIVHGDRPGQATVEVDFNGSLKYNTSIGRDGSRHTGWSGPGDQVVASKSVFYLSALRAPVSYFTYEYILTDVGIRGERTWNTMFQLKADDDARFATILEWSKRFGLGISQVGTPTVGAGQGSIAPMSYGHKTNLILH